MVRGKFQSTLPRRERRGLCNYNYSRSGFQSTLPRRERPNDNESFIDILIISIHAPAKGATFSRYFPCIPLAQFQSTLPRRERPSSMFDIISCGHFNPRSREGSDLNAAVKSSGSNFNFNPRSREGSDNDAIVTIFNFYISIHAPAKGATWATSGQGRPTSFQSTLPRRERHTSDFRGCMRLLISIHAPAKGATVTR